jgi:hypothetical protein
MIRKTQYYVLAVAKLVVEGRSYTQSASCRLEILQLLSVELVAGAGGGWRNNSAMEVQMETGRALLDSGIGGTACYKEPTGAGAGGFGGGGGGCAAGGGGGGFAGLYKMLETDRTIEILFFCLLCWLYEITFYILS